MARRISTFGHGERGERFTICIRIYVDSFFRLQTVEITFVCDVRRPHLKSDYYYCYYYSYGTTTDW